MWFGFIRLPRRRGTECFPGKASWRRERTRTSCWSIPAAGECCAQPYLQHEHAGLKVLAAPADLGQFPTDAREQSLFIVDPLGNLMMRYDVRQNPKGLLQDLKKLLSLSHIG